MLSPIFGLVSTVATLQAANSCGTSFTARSDGSMALRGSDGGADLSTLSPAATGHFVTASLGATATSLSAGASTPRGSAYGSAGNAYAASPSTASRYTSNRVDPYAASFVAGCLPMPRSSAKRVAKPPRAELRGGRQVRSAADPGGVPLAPAEGVTAERPDDSDRCVPPPRRDPLRMAAAPRVDLEFPLDVARIRPAT
jgi:hypothetical protein